VIFTLSVAQCPSADVAESLSIGSLYFCRGLCLRPFPPRLHKEAICHISRRASGYDQLASVLEIDARPIVDNSKLRDPERFRTFVGNSDSQTSADAGRPSRGVVSDNSQPHPRDESLFESSARVLELSFRDLELLLSQLGLGARRFRLIVHASKRPPQYHRAGQRGRGNDSVLYQGDAVHADGPFIRNLPRQSFN
jgi:hypothetical protein